MIFITGDTHRDFSRLNDIPEDSTVIILGDVGINYYLNQEDKKLKKYLNNMKIKLFCVHGNHEERPENIKSYKETDMFDGSVFLEEDYPNLIFAKNGETYNIDNKRVLVIGGAYSVDKEYRLSYGQKWFENEQLSESEQEVILNKCRGKHFDIVLSHTCPLKYEPTEVFMSGLDQTKIDKSMKKFLDKLEESITYNKWYCGHYHTEKQIEKLEFMFGRIKIFDKDCFYPIYDKNGYEILRDSISINDIFKLTCPKGHTDSITLIKGNGFDIIGSDIIAISCPTCKKIYGINDVKYDYNCPKQL